MWSLLPRPAALLIWATGITIKKKLTETQAEAAAAAAAQPTAKTETAGATSYQQSKKTPALNANFSGKWMI